jgi:hypothetical protein
MKESEILWAAKDRVQQGWCQNALRNIYGDVCLAGALLEITGSFYLPVVHALQETIDDYPSLLNTRNLVMFNDDPHTTKQDVLNAIEKTAIRLEEQGR